MIHYQNNRNYLAGVVILYNPTLDVINNIKSYIDPLEHLYIIDNSETTNDWIEQSFFRISKVEYINNQENQGVAKALNITAEKAIEAGYKYLLTMDQDSSFKEGSLEELLSDIGDDNAGIYSPFHKNKFYTNPPTHNGLEVVSDVMTSGNIINLIAIKQVGYFKEDYFIDYVDIEYCMRLRTNGFKVIRNNDSILIHNEANLEREKIFGKTVYPPNHSATRWYYKIRNYLYLKKKYIKDFPDYFEVENLNIRNNMIKVLLFEKYKFAKFHMMLKGLIHYYRNIKGKMPV